MSESKGRYLYEVWPGNNNIYCNGRFITGPDRFCFWLAEFLILGPTILFWVFAEGPLFMSFPPPSTVFIVAILLGIGNIFTTIAMVYSHFKAAFVDPGIMLRTRDEVPENTVREEEVDGKQVVISFCKTCRIWKPPRAHHCRTCDNCILEFDHHCPWVGNCVGQGNYRWFNLFLWFVILGSLYLLIACGVGFGIFLHNTVGATWISTVKDHPWHVGLMCYAFFICLSIFSLCGYHCNLICHGKTTYETLKNLEGGDDRTGCQRLIDTMFGPQRASLFDLHKEVSYSSSSQSDDAEGLLLEQPV